MKVNCKHNNKNENKFLYNEFQLYKLTNYKFNKKLKKLYHMQMTLNLTNNMDLQDTYKTFINMHCVILLLTHINTCKGKCNCV